MNETRSRAAFDDAADSGQSRWLVAAGITGSLAALAVGLCLNRDWLLEQLSRIRWEHKLLLWVSELVGLFWVSHFLGVHCIRRHPREWKRHWPRTPVAAWAFLVASVFLGWALDTAVGVYHMETYWDRYTRGTRSEVTIASVAAYHKKAMGERTYWRLTGHFAAADGQTYPVAAELFWDAQPRGYHVSPEKESLIRRIQTETPPFSMAIRYTHDFPAEYWLDMGERGNPDPELHVLSVAGNSLQVAAFMLPVAFWLGSRRSNSRNPYPPWWCEASGFLTVLIEGWILFFMGLGSLPS